MRRKIAFGLVVLMILMNVMTVFALEEEEKIKPILGIVADSEVQEFLVGERGTLKVQVKNITRVMARNIKISIEGDQPFRADVANVNKGVPDITGYNSREILFDVVVNPNAELKTYEVPITIEHIDEDKVTHKITQKVYVKVINNKVEPILSISGSKALKMEISEGQTAAMVVNVGNTGTVLIKDAYVTVSGFSNEGVILDGDASTKLVKKLEKGKSEVVTYQIKAGQDMKTGTFPVNVSVKYKDQYGNPYESAGIIYLTLKGKADKKYEVDMKIENLKYTQSVKVKEDFKVTFDVVNTSKEDAVNAEVELAYAPEFISKTGTKTFVRELKAGQRKTITYTLMAKSETATETYHSYINVKYIPTLKPDATQLQIQEYVGVHVSGEDKAAEGSKPKLIVDNYNYGGNVVYAGEEFTLDLFIKNTSASEMTKNIKVTLTSDEGVFTPVSSSNSFFVKTIGPGEVYQHSIPLRTKIDAAVKIYAVTVKMEYENASGKAFDEKNNPFAETEALSVAVSQPVRLETADMNVPMDAMAGMPFYIEQEFYNMSKATMYNMMVKFVAEGLQTTQSNYFVGNFDAGRSEFYSTQVTAMAPGTYEGKLVYSFEDALGTVTALEKPFTVNVTEMVMPDGDVDPNIPPVDGLEPVEKPFPTKWVLIGAGIALIFITMIVLKIRKKRRIKRELEALDE